jgi:NAD(P)-dependent dehydrogenase (short-subunit alcohol dehydrogenase family)
VVVTGAANGMGRAMVEAFAALGDAVVATDLPGARLDEVGAREGVVAVAGDLVDPATPARILDAAGGRVDVLNNVAGLLDGLRPVDEVDEEEWQRVLTVNLTAPYRLCHAVVPLMVAQGAGVITNVASAGGIRGGRAGAAYTASKHGLVGLSQNIAITHGLDGVRCNALCPGATIGTAIGEGQTISERGQASVAASLRRKPAEPRQIADVAVFLAGDAASHVNGAVLPVDYGQTAI